MCIPENMPVIDWRETPLKRGVHKALIVDEYGAFQGIATPYTISNSWGFMGLHICLTQCGLFKEMMVTGYGMVDWPSASEEDPLLSNPLLKKRKGC